MVSSLGRVISLKNCSGMKFVGHIKPTGYTAISVGKKEYFVHRLVALAFLPNPENKKEENHIDGNRSNNSVENLEWCTRSENAKHMYISGLADRKRCTAHFRKKVVCLETGVVFNSCRECAKNLGVQHQRISFAIKHGSRCKGKHFDLFKGE